MNEADARHLLNEYLTGSLSDTEREAFASLLNDPAQAEWLDRELKASFADGRFLSAEPESRKKMLTERIYEGMRSAVNLPDEEVAGSLPTVHRIHFLRTAWFRYAAALLLVAGTAVYLYQTMAGRNETLAKKATIPPAHISPGGNKATLTLSDGRTIVLESAGNATLAQQGGTTIIKVDAGALAYQPGAPGGELLYNTVTTPRGGQYQVTLPDGTIAWLNASSSITFPTAFSGSQRVLTMTGEVYLEVASRPVQPFIVNTGNNTSIEVLGTHFNVNAYRDEHSIVTTLLQGAVRVKAPDAQQILAPGQQARVDGAAGIRLLTKVNMEQVMAWKNGYFDFNGSDVKSIVREICRWYDVEAYYEKEPEPRDLSGKMERNLSFSQAMATLEDLGVHCRLEGKKLIVMK